VALPKQTIAQGLPTSTQDDSSNNNALFGLSIPQAVGTGVGIVAAIAIAITAACCIKKRRKPVSVADIDSGLVPL
jgi:hypothetical protein